MKSEYHVCELCNRVRTPENVVLLKFDFKEAVVVITRTDKEHVGIRVLCAHCLDQLRNIPCARLPKQPLGISE